MSSYRPILIIDAYMENISLKSGFFPTSDVSLEKPPSQGDRGPSRVPRRNLEVLLLLTESPTARQPGSWLRGFIFVSSLCKTSSSLSREPSKAIKIMPYARTDCSVAERPPGASLHFSLSLS